MIQKYLVHLDEIPTDGDLEELFDGKDTLVVDGVGGLEEVILAFDEDEDCKTITIIKKEER